MLQFLILQVCWTRKLQVTDLSIHLHHKKEWIIKTYRVSMKKTMWKNLFQVRFNRISTQPAQRNKREESLVEWLSIESRRESTTLYHDMTRTCDGIVWTFFDQHPIHLKIVSCLFWSPAHTPWSKSTHKYMNKYKMR